MSIADSANHCLSVHRNISVVDELAEDVKVVWGIGFGGVVELGDDLFEGIFSILSNNIINQSLPCHLL